MAAPRGAVGKATLKGKYDLDKNTASAVATVALTAGNVRLKASATDATFVNGPSLAGLILSAERPGAFMIDYDVPRKDWRFQFMNSIKLKEKPVSLTYIHFLGANRTTLDGTVTFDSANKVSCNYAFGAGNCKLKYTYAHGNLSGLGARRASRTEPPRQTLPPSPRGKDPPRIAPITAADSLSLSLQGPGCCIHVLLRVGSYTPAAVRGKERFKQRDSRLN